MCNTIGTCDLQVDPGPCDNTNERYFFNSTSGQCENFNYGGCHGNENKFYFWANCFLQCDSKSIITLIKMYYGYAYSGWNSKF